MMHVGGGGLLWTPRGLIDKLDRPNIRYIKYDRLPPKGVTVSGNTLLPTSYDTRKNQFLFDFVA